jgi:hypothetical protein
LLEYNPNQIGVSWTSQAELDKFAGYLVITAKQDRRIHNPYAWATKALKNLKENGINSRWLEFTGERLLDPNSPEALFLRNYFHHPASAGANIVSAAHDLKVRGASPLGNQPLDSVSEIIDRTTAPIVADEHLSSSVERVCSHQEQKGENVQGIARSPDSLSPESRNTNTSPPEDTQTPIPTSTTNCRQPGDCPQCGIPTYPNELERWDMCRFCATKILFKRII